MAFAAPRQRLHTRGQSYCVDGFVVERLSSTGAVVREHIPMESSYSFEWNQLPQTVTVEAYNSLGSSGNNINITLEKTPKRESAADNPSRVVGCEVYCSSMSLMELIWCKTMPLALILLIKPPCANIFAPKRKPFTQNCS